MKTEYDRRTRVASKMFKLVRAINKHRNHINGQFVPMLDIIAHQLTIAQETLELDDDDEEDEETIPVPAQKKRRSKDNDEEDDDEENCDCEDREDEDEECCSTSRGHGALIDIEPIVVHTMHPTKGVIPLLEKVEGREPIMLLPLSNGHYAVLSFFVKAIKPHEGYDNHWAVALQQVGAPKEYVMKCPVPAGVGAPLSHIIYPVAPYSKEE